MICCKVYFFSGSAELANVLKHGLNERFVLINKPKNIEVRLVWTTYYTYIHIYIYSK